MKRYYLQAFNGLDFYFFEIWIDLWRRHLICFMLYFLGPGAVDRFFLCSYYNWHSVLYSNKFGDMNVKAWCTYGRNLKVRIWFPVLEHISKIFFFFKKMYWSNLKKQRKIQKKSPGQQIIVTLPLEGKRRWFNMIADKQVDISSRLDQYLSLGIWSRSCFYCYLHSIHLDRK